jgi:CheY-like chemotaxis protein
LVRDADYFLQAAITGKAKIEYGLAENLPAIEADPAQVRQAVVNLVRNAGEAMGGEGGRITVSTGERDCDRAYLRESCQDDGLFEGSYAYVEVSDTGCGMDDVTRSRVFDPFFSTKFTGRGLGLPAALGIMRGHRGAIKIRSVKGQGTTVQLLFPVSGKPGESLEPGTPPLETWKGKGTVLVVDDEDTVRLLAKAFLEEKGFEVWVASDGAEAVEIFRRNPGEIVAVVLDMTMPGMGGAETFQEIRKTRKDVPILVSSGYNQRNIAARMAGASRFGFIQKPYQLMDLLARLREIMKTEA